MTNETNTPEASKPLSNAKHEKFAQGVADGMTQANAYVAAGYKNNKGVKETANKLTTNPLLKARIEFLKQSVSDAIIKSKTHTSLHIWERLLKSIDNAETAGDHKAAADLVKTAVEAAGLNDPSYTRKAIFGEKVETVDTNPQYPESSNVSSLTEAIEKQRAKATSSDPSKFPA